MANIVHSFPTVQKLLTKAEYKPAYGARLVKLEETIIGSVSVSLLHVQIDPGKEIAAHMHEHGGEICQALSEVTAYLGEPLRDEHGNYQIEEDKIVTEWEPPIHMEAGDTISIPEGKAHFFINHGYSETSNIQFVIPNSHFILNKDGSMDKKLNTRPQL